MCREETAETISRVFARFAICKIQWTYPPKLRIPRNISSAETPNRRPSWIAIVDERHSRLSRANLSASSSVSAGSLQRVKIQLTAAAEIYLMAGFTCGTVARFRRHARGESRARAQAILCVIACREKRVRGARDNSISSDSRICWRELLRAHPETARESVARSESLKRNSHMADS